MIELKKICQFKRNLFYSFLYLIKIFFVLGGITTNIMGQNTELPKYFASAVHITANGAPQGSGCLVNYNGAIYLVTAAHILFEIKNDEISNELKFDRIQIKIFDTKYEEKESIIEIDIKPNFIRKHDEKDICAIKVAEVIEVLQENRFDFKYQTQLNENIKVVKNDGSISSVPEKVIKTINQIRIGQEIRLVGYPSYLDEKNWGGNYSDFNYNYPLVNGGVISGYSSSSKNLIVSSPVFYGNSGGPVFQVSPIYEIDKTVLKFESEYGLIGIVSKFVRFHYKKLKNAREINEFDTSNSGYSVVIPIEFALELMD